VEGGVASKTIVLSGGIEYDNLKTVSTTVSSGGIEFVSGTANKTSVTSGGLMYVDSGAVATSSTVSSGGTVIIDGGTFLATVMSARRYRVADYFWLNPEGLRRALLSQPAVKDVRRIPAFRERHHGATISLIGRARES
jgi:autotransporter passenger strand-loop-strand repeat protein